MRHEVMLWNDDKTASVKASIIKTFNIYKFPPAHPKQWKLVGWINKNECFTFGFFETQEQAQWFLLDIHERIENSGTTHPRRQGDLRSEEVAKKIVGILMTADGGCPVCAAKLIEKFSTQFPEWKDLAYQAYWDEFECFPERE